MHFWIEAPGGGFCLGNLACLALYLVLREFSWHLSVAMLEVEHDLCSQGMFYYSVCRMNWESIKPGKEDVEMNIKSMSTYTYTCIASFFYL